MAEEKVVLSSLLRRFKFELSPTAPNPSPSMELTLKSATGISLYVSRLWLPYKRKMNISSIPKYISTESSSTYTLHIHLPSYFGSDPSFRSWKRGFSMLPIGGSRWGFISGSPFSLKMSSRDLIFYPPWSLEGIGAKYTHGHSMLQYCHNISI